MRSQQQTVAVAVTFHQSYPVTADSELEAEQSAVLELRFLDNYPPYNSVFKADKKLIDLACETCDEKGYARHIGRIVSGEAFISSSEVKSAICERLSPLAVDMETAAVGHCAFMNEVPFVSIRCISDNADDEGEMSFDEFEKIAAKRVAEIVLEMIKKV